MTTPRDSGAGLKAVEETFAVAQTEQSGFKREWAKLMGHHSKPVLHKKTSVLMLYWDPKCTDMQDIEKEVNELQKVFEQDYGYQVIKRQFNTETYPETQALNHVLNFKISEDADDGLLIVYYAGHGGSTANELGRITLTGTSSSDGSEKLSDDHEKYHSIDWETVEGVLKKTKSDVLEIFDCCHAGLLCAPYKFRGSSTRCFDILAACSREERTPEPGPHSFTKALTWALKRLSKQKGFSTLDLYNRIHDAPKFDGKRQPQVYGGRFESHSEYLWLAPIPESGKEGLGITHQQRDEEMKQETMVDIRYHYEGEVNAEDLKALTKAIKNMLKSPNVRASSVTAVGKYDRDSFRLDREAKAKAVLTAWKRRVGPASSAELNIQAVLPAPTRMQRMLSISHAEPVLMAAAAEDHLCRTIDAKLNETHGDLKGWKVKTAFMLIVMYMGIMMAVLSMTSRTTYMESRRLTVTRTLDTPKSSKFQPASTFALAWDNKNDIRYALPPGIGNATMHIDYCT